MPKAYPVTISGEARADAERIHDYIARDKPRAAGKWFRGFVKRARSLRFNPHRYEEIPEADQFGVPIRHILFGNYRIFYLVEDQRVRILRVHEAARQLPVNFFAT